MLIKGDRLSASGEQILEGDLESAEHPDPDDDNENTPS